MIRLGSNITSLGIQRNLGRVTQNLSKVSERLASGKRINSASDDAAGLAIASSLEKDQRLATTAIRNINDGLSIVAVTTSALDSQKTIISRMMELAAQSANGVYSANQREALQTEYISLMDEFDRIAESTEFNGVKLLRNKDGNTIQLQTGITGAASSLLNLTPVNSHRFAGYW